MENERPGIEQADGREGAEARIGDGGDELAAVRELVLRAHPDTVPELVSGANVSELLASVEPARTAYQRLAEKLAGDASAASPVVPAGTTPPLAIDPDRLPATEKIRRGLKAVASGQ